MVNKIKQDKLMEQYKNTGDIKYKKKLIEKMMPFINYKSQEFASFLVNVPFEDIVQSASLGLSLAIDKFDPERGIKLTTFCEKYMLDQVQQANSAYHLCGMSRNIATKIKNYTEATEQLQEKNQNPTIDKVSNITGYTKKTIVGIENLISNSSLDIDLGDGLTLYDILEGEPPNKKAVNLDIMVDRIKLFLGSDDADMFIRYYLYDETLEHIGNIYDISKERVRQRLSRNKDILKRIFSY